jgi:hypothetical protein
LFFQGSCTAKSLIPIVVNAMKSVNPDDGLPLWENVSSNIGNAKTDDGYVMYSKGENGQRDIFIGFKSENSFYINNRYDYGYTSFIANDYVPSENAGSNGKFDEIYMTGMPLIKGNGTEVMGFTAETLPLKYMLNVNKERIILAYWTDLKTPNAYVNVIYSGRPSQLTDPNMRTSVMLSHMLDQSTQHLASAHGNGVVTNMKISPSYSYPWIIHSRNSLYSAGRKSRGWGNTFFPSTMILYGSYHGNLFGSLDMFIALQEGTYRHGDSVTINNEEYGVVEADFQYTDVSNRGDFYNSFTGANKGKLVYLIPKK